MKKFSLYFLLLVIVLFLAYYSINIGNYAISPVTIWGILSSKIFGTALPHIQNYEDIIVCDLRLPRIIMVMLVGAGLAVSGAASQGIFRNPLISPFILGVSSGASLGAALAIVYLGQIAYSIDFCAGLGGALAVLMAFFVAKRPDGTVPRLSLVLAGVIISSLFTSLTGIVKYIAEADTQLPAITFWMMGGFGSITWKTLDMVTWIIPINVVLMVVFAWQLNILSLGDREAKLLGMNIEHWKYFYIYLVVSTVGICVARTGTIGWVGLVIPHIGRAITGPNHRSLMPVAALLGAIFMLLCDDIARTITSGEIPIGIITAIIGTPFFIYYLRKKGASVWN